MSNSDSPLQYFPAQYLPVSYQNKSRLPAGQAILIALVAYINKYITILGGFYVGQSQRTSITAYSGRLPDTSCTGQALLLCHTSICCRYKVKPFPACGTGQAIKKDNS